MTDYTTLPDLISGAGDTPAEGACIMQAAAWLGDNHAWTDAPTCVHPSLRRVAIWINDSVGREHRQQLWPLVPRLIGTTTSDPQADRLTGVLLAIWGATRVLPLVKDPERHARAQKHISSAQRWASGQEKPPAADAASAYASSAYASAAYAAYASASAYAAYAAYAAASSAYASAAAYAAASYADAAYADAAYAAASAAYASAYASASADDAKIKFLTDMLDEYDRITGRTTPAEIPPAAWDDLRATIGTQA